MLHPSHFSSGSAAVTVTGPRPPLSASTRTLSISQWNEGPSSVYLATTSPYAPCSTLSRYVSCESPSGSTYFHLPRKPAGIGAEFSAALLRATVSSPSPLVQIRVPLSWARRVCFPPSEQPSSGMLLTARDSSTIRLSNETSGTTSPSPFLPEPCQVPRCSLPITPSTAAETDGSGEAVTGVLPSSEGSAEGSVLPDAEPPLPSPAQLRLSLSSSVPPFIAA
ncbi:hypothetical protein A6A29_27185 [Streptomyces sp. TSRI0281]|nr:hypothetical protein A6A29_27185 [Streptomyces sp. TSRI0281]